MRKRRRYAVCILIGVTFFFTCDFASASDWWKKWDNYPKVPKISAKQVKELLAAGEKVVLIYAGYEVNDIVCGSYYIPYTYVPPNASGSKIKIKIPKNYWVMCY